MGTSPSAVGIAGIGSDVVTWIHDYGAFTGLADGWCEFPAAGDRSWGELVSLAEHCIETLIHI